MKLLFKEKYISITDFDSVDLPDLVVLTGVNGSGKSHLLGAIENRKVILEGSENASIVLFNYETLKLDQEAQWQAYQLSQEKEQLWQTLQNSVKPQIVGFKSALTPVYESLKGESVANNRSLLDSPNPNAAAYKSHIRKFFGQANFRGSPQYQSLNELAHRIPTSLDDVSRDEFDRKITLEQLKQDFSPQQLGKTIWNYYSGFRNNQINEFQNERYGGQLNCLPEAEFRKRFGNPPWEVINEVLQAFDSLQYEVESPEGKDHTGGYQLKLRHKERADLNIDFNELSSGERVLMALVACIYKSNTSGRFPDVLLLDEVDASLHPSMMKNLLHVIQTVFLARGVKVVLVTHSPTMLAIAPEAAVYVMNRSGRNRVEKKTKREALSILTEGFATLDEVLRVFDDVSSSKVTVISEGNNVKVLERFFQLKNLEVNVLKGIQEKTGSSQLRTLFHFFSRVPHRLKIIFIFDCDVSFNEAQTDNVRFSVLKQNPGNVYATKGIENAFPTKFFDKYLKQITSSLGKTQVSFDDGRKADLGADFVANADITDFSYFEPLVDDVKRMQGCSSE